MGEEKEKLAAAASQASVAYSPPVRKPEPRTDATQPSAEEGGQAATADEGEKKVRALRKKLRDIEKLKEKPEKDLDPLQKEKIKGEADIRKQMRELGAEE